MSPEQIQKKLGDLVASILDTKSNGHVPIRNKYTDSLWRFDRSLMTRYPIIAGVDEAGRGPLAGPVVCCAVIMPYAEMISGINDSKALSPKQRNILTIQILNHAIDIGIAQTNPTEIDRLNIRIATLNAMKAALAQLSCIPDLALIDGKDTLDISIYNRSIIKGDETSYAIACASITAKVVRDKIMEGFDIQYPGYYFAKHKGYPTKLHYQRIHELGPSPIHRMTFLSNLHYENS